MKPFLSKLAEYLKDNYASEIENICLVLPNRRAKLFLRNRIGETFAKPIWSPDLYSIEEFVEVLADGKKIDNLEAVLFFYKVYKNIERENAQSFDEYLHWAPTLLQDFNELDQYLVNAADLFSYLSDERAISLWNPDGKSLTDFQNKYLKFWQSLKVYYLNYQHELKSKGLYTSGMAYRMVADQISDIIKKQKWKKVIFAGFNALNKSELKIFETLSNEGLADILWDSDSYYVNDGNQEAGKFIRGFKEKFGKYNSSGTFLWESAYLMDEPKNVVIAGVAQQVGQAKVAGEILQKIALEKEGNMVNCALVLADENLLMPVLHSMPEEINKFNVTMGYPLANLSLHTLIEQIFELQENLLRFNKNLAHEKYRFYYRDLKKILSHPLVEAVIFSYDKSTENAFIGRDFIYYLEKNNILFVPWSDLESYFTKDSKEIWDVIAFFIKPWENDIHVCLDTILLLIEKVRLSYEKRKDQSDALQREVLFQYSKICKRLKTLFQENEVGLFNETRTIRSIFNQLVKSQTISFIGEPLEGLQLMGMLESRTLDFETIVLLSANEGVLPSGKKENSFIPFDLKNKFELPTYLDKDAIYAYHFYRLLQCAKTVYLIYNTETDELGSGERSRFITQLLHEWKLKNRQITIEEKLYAIPIGSGMLSAKITIPKDELVFEKINKLFENGLSASLLNKYRLCSLRFYFSYILNLKERDEPEESIDAAVFGEIVHKILENAFNPFIEKKITSSELEKSFGNIQENVQNTARTIVKSGDINSGKNLLILKVAEKYVRKFLREEQVFLDDLTINEEDLELIGLEKTFDCKINVGSKAIKLYGKIDRLDKVGDCFRIIDYKTGKVDESSQLRLKTWDDLKKTEKNKAFQLLFYAYLIAKNQDVNASKIIAGIISFRSLSQGLLNVKIENKEEITMDVIEQFESQLLQLIQEMSNPDLPFIQTDDTDVCKHCEYNLICNR